MIMLRMKIGKFLSAIAFLLLLLPSSSLAADFRISPLLIDVEAEARDIISKDITLTNESESKLVLYATVNEVAVDTTGEVKEFISPSMDDRTTAITSWIEITRGRIELEPKETKTIPLALRINPYAKAGVYNAFVGFVQTSKRPDAERVALLGDADGVIIKATLGSKSSDLLRIDAFLIDRFILNDTQRMITINVKNEGDTDVIPTGEIIFYNSRGEEVASAVVNNQSETVVAGETKQLTLAVPFHSELGRFKANVRLNYGADQKALVFDTTQFFMIPPFLAIAIVIGIIVFSVLVTYLIRRAFYDELHEEEDGNSLPLYVRNNRDHEEKDHDITIIKS
jgi:hypothetical protein